jgi:Uma2 family endonuclease
MSVQVNRRHFTVDEYARMSETGLLRETDRVELIEGEVLEMRPIGSRHAACVRRLDELLQRQLGRRVQISVQNPIRLDDFSEPQPDLALLRPRADFYAAQHPLPADVLVVVEVADTSADYDRRIKVPLYARAGIPEVWLIDLTGESVEVYAQPRDGEYQTTQPVGRGATVNAHSLAQLTVSVDDILG